MFEYDLTDKLRKKIKKLNKKNPVLARIFKRKLLEVIKHNKTSIDTYKNLKSPQNEFKRIHLTNNYVLLFQVFIEDNFILFVDILHRDDAYN